MASNSHALLSASASHRWLHCPPSARLTEHIADKPSEYASEGSTAHLIAEIKLSRALGYEPDEPTLFDNYSAEMEECTNGYVSFVMEQVQKLKDEGKNPLVLVEQRLNYSKYVEEGYGTGDTVIVADGLVHIIDYKHGRGVRVDSTNNPQMMLYALGALDLFDGIYDIDTVSMSIYQPRLSNVSTFEMTKQDLIKWAEEVLVPISKLAFRGEGQYSCGEWCSFCKAKSTCKERARLNTELAKMEFKEAPLLTDEEIVEVLTKVDGLVAWANDVKEYAFNMALKGKKWDGFKLVEGRSTRKYADETKVAEAVIEAGFNPYDKKVVGITEMQKRLGKTKFLEIVEPFIIKPAGKPTMVEESDSRPEYNNATIEFMTMEENY